MRISNVNLLAEIDGLAQVLSCETDELEVIKHIHKIEHQIEEMAMIIRTLIIEKQSVRNAKSYLIKHGLQGNPLR